MIAEKSQNFLTKSRDQHSDILEGGSRLALPLRLICVLGADGKLKADAAPTPALVTERRCFAPCPTWASQARLRSGI
jgi:hypothetical protein